MSAIEIQNLWKHYSGHWALRDVSLEVKPGRVVGVFGENGGGKSTLFQIIANILRPSQGVVRIFGKTPGRATRQMVSFMPEVNHYPVRMTIRELVHYLQCFYTGWDLSKTEELLKFMGLKWTDKIQALSKGQKARLRMINAFSWPAQVILLDEPLGAVDPVSRKKILEVLFSEFKAQGQTMLICSHLLTELEAFIDDAAYLQQGKLVLSGDTAQLQKEHGKSLLEIFEALVG
ncbi:ABC transporter ATP-binding protein [Deltaproteobacteria bacterium TL4]